MKTKLIWKNVSEGYPPCDSETVFVGINSNGYCGCFNIHGLMSAAYEQRSICLYSTAEGCDEIMEGLEWWAELHEPPPVAFNLPQLYPPFAQNEAQK